MLSGVIDLTFLASEDFAVLTKKTKSMTFAMHSPLAWHLGYTRYGQMRKWDEEFRSFLMPFFDLRFERVERSNVESIGKNLKEGISTGNIVLVRNNFSDLYDALANLLRIREQRVEFMAVRDLSNVLLANQLKLPLWIEGNAERWIEKIYAFHIKEKSREILFPLVPDNPRPEFRDALTRLMAGFNQRVPLREIAEKFIDDLSGILESAAQYKGIVLAALEPLPVWEGLPLDYRYLCSTILTMIDVWGIRRNQ